MRNRHTCFHYWRYLCCSHFHNPCAQFYDCFLPLWMFEIFLYRKKRNCFVYLIKDRKGILSVLPQMSWEVDCFYSALSVFFTYSPQYLSLPSDISPMPSVIIQKIAVTFAVDFYIIQISRLQIVNISPAAFTLPNWCHLVYCPLNICIREVLSYYHKFLFLF